ncbi:MAG: NAD-dependent epimerase/dehydratase family protein [Chlorobiota bacterium]|nr:NAD-dependent epimerase/dehydratase family protein [Chlorobiota bacterium]
MRIAVTGGAGFIGSHVVDAYVAAGHEVLVIDNLSTGRREYVHPQARLVVMDIADPAVEELLRRECIEVLNHHAAQIDLRYSVTHPEEDARQNILGSLRLYEAARRAGVRRIILASTGGAIYGEQQEFPAEEMHPTAPIAPYGVSKLAAEKYLECYARLYGIEAVVLRYTNVYGPRQNPKGEAGVVAIFLGKLLAGEPPLIYGDGEQTRDYIYVEDVARANLAALEPAASGVYNCSTGVETSVNALLHMLQQLTGRWIAPQYCAARPGELRRSVCSPERLRRELGWCPQVPLPEGLFRTLQALQAQAQ